MRNASFRRLFAGLLATAAFGVVTIVGAAAPAHAAPSGYLLTKGTGSVYTSSTFVNQGGVPGGAARSFSYKIVNTGTTSQQFKLSVNASDVRTEAVLLQGSRVLPKPYYTAPIAPGGNLVLTLKVSIAAGAPQGEYLTEVHLRDPETSAALDTAYADVHATYQTGNTARDLFLKTGTQPYVGGSHSQQIETANTLKVGSTATFRLRLQNNSGAPGPIGLTRFPTFGCASDYAVVVKQGTKDVTAAVNAGSYTTGILGPGAKQELKVTIKLLSASFCSGVYFAFQSSGGITQHAHVVTAA